MLVAKPFISAFPVARGRRYVLVVGKVRPSAGRLGSAMIKRLRVITGHLQPGAAQHRQGPGPAGLQIHCAGEIIGTPVDTYPKTVGPRNDIPHALLSWAIFACSFVLMMIRHRFPDSSLPLSDTRRDVPPTDRRLSAPADVIRADGGGHHWANDHRVEDVIRILAVRLPTSRTDTISPSTSTSFAGSPDPVRTGSRGTLSRACPTECGGAVVLKTSRRTSLMVVPAVAGNATTRCPRTTPTSGAAT